MEQTEGKVTARVCVCERERVCEGVCVCVCVLEGRTEEGTTRKGRPRNETQVGRKTFAGKGGPLGGPEGLEGGVEGWGRVGVWRGFGGGAGEVATGMRDGVALSWELGVEVGWGWG